MSLDQMTAAILEVEAEERAKRSTAPSRDRIRQDPVGFIRGRLHGDPWEKQEEIVKAVFAVPHVAVRSCHGAGKDWIAARIVLAFSNAFDVARVISTGPTDRQVRGILWAEIAAAFKRADPRLPGDLLTQQYHISEENFALGFTTKNKAGGDGASRFQGWHAPNILVVIDEASGVPTDIYTEVSGVLSSQNAHLLEIGNPTNPTGEFAAAFKTPGVYKIKISAFDTPNFTAFGITQEDIESGEWKARVTGPLPRPELITPQWVADRYRKWGKDSPLYQSRVLAEFPVAGVDQLIPLHWVERAQNDVSLTPSPNGVLGVDVARYGDAFTVLTLRRGGVIRTVARYAQADTMTTAGYVALALRSTGAEAAVIDVVGLGAGVYDRCAENGLPVYEFNSGAKPRDGERFASQRDETYWMLREGLEQGAIDLDPQDEELAGQLGTLKWKPDSRGRVMIESKEDMRKRGVSSPDDADAAAMTFYTGVGMPYIWEGERRTTAGLFGAEERDPAREQLHKDWGLAPQGPGRGSGPRVRWKMG